MIELNQLLNNQIYSFLLFIGIGILITLIFDIFRILRKSFKTPDILTLFEDFIFLVIVGFILLYSIFKFNSGELRLYVLLGIIVGGVTYLATISKTFITINVIIIKAIEKVLINIINPITYVFKTILKFARKIFLRPISFSFFNFQKSFTNGVKKLQILQKKKK